MSSNLLQNYIAAKSAMPAAPQKPYFDIQKELDNRTFIKPLRGRGKLIDETPFTMPQSFVSGVVYDVKALKHAVCGSANDHELGKLNDVGMMGGMLAIAAYLKNLRNTPVLKGMEFAGPLAFLASMALWPKLAIQLPAYLIHGVNVGKKYQDSFGRIKPFYQDPQFIPWDLYSDDKIQKIGDRMGVPKDIPNRRDFIQEKMRKLAIQNNTLWMLTAGFATPVMASLMCDAFKPHYAKYMDNKQNKKADSILANFDKYSEKYQKPEIFNKLQELKKLYADKPINKEFAEQIISILGNDLDVVTLESFKKDVTELLFNGNFIVSEKTAKDIRKNIQERLEIKNLSQEFISAVLPSEERMIELFRDNDLFKPVSSDDFHKFINVINNEITTSVNIFNAANPESAEDIRYVRCAILAVPKENHPVYKELQAVRANTFDSALQKKLGDTAKILDEFRAKSIALDEYAVLKVGAAPETVIANYWNDVSGSLLKLFGFTDEELESVRFSNSLTGKLLREKVDTIASDRDSYERVMKSLVEKISSINSKIKSSDITSHLLQGDSSKIEPTVYEKTVDRVFDGYAASIKSQGFVRTAEALAGSDGDAFCTAKAIQKAYVEERLLGVKSSFYRLINALDFFRRAATNPNDMQTFNTVSREVREELIELCKMISLDGHSSDFATKFYMLRNPNPSPDMSPIEVVNGRIKYKYLSQNVGRTDIPGDKYFYQNGMNFMFGESLHPETRAILEKSVIKDEVLNYRELIMDKIGGDKYFWKPRHRVRNSGVTSSNIKFLLVGVSPNELLFKSGQQVFNSKKWLKMFGGFGICLLGVTVLAQFFLGKLKLPQKGAQND